MFTLGDSPIFQPFSPFGGAEVVAAPDAPANVAATGEDQQVAVTWDVSAGATAYDVYRSETDTFATAATVTTNEATTAYDDVSAVPGTLYYYWVVAKTGAVASAESLSDSGRAYLVLPPGVTNGIVVPSGTWTLGTLFFGTTLTTDFYITDYQGIPYYWDSGWFDDVAQAPSDGVVVTAGLTFNFQNFGGTDITIWNGNP